jgi:nitronate monooxygenase
MPGKDNFSERFQLSVPVIQAPLAGGGDTPQLVAAVCEAGGMGFIGAAYLTPERILQTGKEVRRRTSRPFGINLFAPLPPCGAGDHPEQALERVAPFFAELNLPAPSLPAPEHISFEDRLEAALETDASAFSFTFGLLPETAMRAIRGRGLFIAGTATTVEEALLLEQSGVDAVVAQGSEAGGHRGTFASDFRAGMIGTMALVPQVVDAVKVPVIASGGIMDGRGIVASLALGASAVQMGTAFLTCDESGIPEAYKQAIFSAREQDTRITRAFSGRPARGIANRFMTAVEPPSGPEAILPFPHQNALTRPLRTEARRQERADLLSLWAGQALRLARRQTAAALMTQLRVEIETAGARLQSSLLHLPAHPD